MILNGVKDLTKADGSGNVAWMTFRLPAILPVARGDYLSSLQRTNFFARDCTKTHAITRT